MKFDFARLYNRLDAHRVNHTALSWRKFGELIGMDSSTFSRLKSGSGMSVNNLVIILNVLKDKFEDYL